MKKQHKAAGSKRQSVRLINGLLSVGLVFPYITQANGEQTRLPQGITPKADAPITIAISDAEPSPERSGFVSFVVRLSRASNQTITVNYCTLDNTAKAPDDYTTRSGTLTFTPGETQQTINVTVITDSIVEPNESFFLDLKNPTNATLLDSRGSAYILNDDGPRIRMATAYIDTEGNSGTKIYYLPLLLTTTSTQIITVDYTTRDASAKDGEDYIAKSGTVTFALGETQKSVEILVKGDTTVEPNEYFRLQLTHPTNAVIFSSSCDGIIRNDDTASTPTENKPSE